MLANPFGSQILKSYNTELSSGTFQRLCDMYSMYTQSLHLVKSINTEVHRLFTISCEMISKEQIKISNIQYNDLLVV